MLRARERIQSRVGHRQALTEEIVVYAREGDVGVVLEGQMSS